MKYSINIIALLAFFITGCSPQVYLSVSNPQPPLAKTIAPILYSEDQQVPPTAESLGSARVESGIKRKNGSEEALRLLGEATTTSGGNAMRIIERFEPDPYAPQRIYYGEILRLPDSLYTACIDTGTPTLPVWDVEHDVNWTRGANHMLFFNVGYDFVLTKLFNTPPVTGDPSQSLGINGGYQWTSLYGIGGGFRYAGYMTTLGYGFNKLHIGLHYFAPEFVLRQDLGKRWQLRESVGIGYALYTERIDHLSSASSGVGYHLNLEAEYRVFRYIGIGAGVTIYATHFGSTGQWIKNTGGYSGFTRISLSGGIRCYF